MILFRKFALLLAVAAAIFGACRKDTLLGVTLLAAAVWVGMSEERRAEVAAERRAEVSQRLTEEKEAHREFAERRSGGRQRRTEGMKAHGEASSVSLRTLHEPLWNQPAPALEEQPSPALEEQHDPALILPHPTADLGNMPSLSPLYRAIPPVALVSAVPALPTYFANAPKRRKPKAPNWWLGASAYYGLSNVQRNGQADYVAIRAEQETALDLLQGGLDLRRRLGKQAFVQTGIYFTQWTDRRTTIFKETYTEMDSNHLVTRILRSDGSIENVYGPVEIQHIRTLTQEQYNRYRHLEVPILAGLSLPVGTRWRFDVSAGPVIGLLGTRSGGVQRVSGMGTQPLSDAPYRNSATIAGTVRLEWLYATRDWSAGIGIMGRTALNDWAKANPYFSEKRSAIGAGVVFRRALGR